MSSHEHAPLANETTWASIEAGLAQLLEAPSSANPMLCAVFGLDLISRAALGHQPGCPIVPGEMAGRYSRAFFEAATTIAVAIPSSAMSADRVYAGMGIASALLTAPDDGLHADRLLHTGLLIAELRAFLCRREITRRNDPLGRVIAARLAWNAAGETPASTQ